MTRNAVQFTTDQLLIGGVNVYDTERQRWVYEFLTLEENGGEAGAVPMREIGNVVCIGAPGSGKTRLIEAQLMNWGQSIVVIDLKGGLYRTTAAYRQTLGPVIVLDPRDGRGSRYNPLAVIRLKQRRQLAITLAGRGEQVSGSDRFWVNNAADVWLACWHAADEVQRPHIPYAVEIINMGLIGALRYLAAYHGQNPMCMRIIRNFAGQAITPEFLKRLEEVGASKLLESKWATVVESAAPFADVNMLAIFNGHDIDVARMFRVPTTVYIMADETDEEGFGAFARLVMKTMGDALIQAGDKLSFDRRLPVLFMFDEFGAVRINNARTWLNTMRSRGVVFWIFAQSLAQLIPESGGRYDPNAENSIHHWIVFSPTSGTNDAGRFIAELSGTTTVEVEGGYSTSYNTSSDGVQQSRSVSYRERHNVESEDIDAWSMNEAAVSIRPNGRPRRFFGRVHVANAADLGLMGGVSTQTNLPPLLPPYIPPTFPEPGPLGTQDEDNGRGRDRTQQRSLLDAYNDQLQQEDDDDDEQNEG